MRAVFWVKWDTGHRGELNTCAFSCSAYMCVYMMMNMCALLLTPDRGRYMLRLGAGLVQWEMARKLLDVWRDS